MTQPLENWIPRLANQRVMVIGDVILDEYLIGKATRMSREAPVPVLEFESRQIIPGGAANPAANITMLGSTAVQVGVIGSDTAGVTLRQVLQARGIDTQALITDPGRPTTVKTRIMAQMGLRFPQQVARMDTLSREPVNGTIERQIFELINQQLGTVQAVLLSDYHSGLLTESLVESVRHLATQAGLILIADAQGELSKYRQFTLVKCNAEEAQTFLRRELADNADFASAARDLCDSLELTGAMVITRGADGATVATCGGEITHCPAPAVSDVYDVVGAGDTSIAVLTLGVGAGMAFDQATTLANYASGVVVRRVGNYTPSPDELLWALRNWQVNG